ncbi:hypothetical protein Igag_0828 [Ignisphaera aggregans DSM 17230]|uniref:Uncharacterized protein n=1 Tax=Ignisphaera aggregans (strain DSM 17230 / JCM 13409 / AQ1.S1) TaxID=583356 RepID=E0STN5_IGNAA|nr:hypothetical protein Igag_0828 [Ignisphaera aggregans DSM 17230]
MIIIKSIVVLVGKYHLELISTAIDITVAEIIATSPVVKAVEMSGEQLADSPSKNLLAVIMASESDASMNGTTSINLCCLYNEYPRKPVHPTTTTVPIK